MHDSPVFARIATLIDRFAIPIVGIWMFGAVGLFAAAPSVEQLILTHSSPIIPTSTQSGQALKRMGEAFDESSSNNTTVIIVEKGTPFSDADRAFRAQLMQRLRSDARHVQSALDMWSDPQLSQLSESPDKQVALAQVQLEGDVGSPMAFESVKAVQTLLDAIPKPAGITVYATGLSQAAVDQVGSLLHDVLVVGVVSVFLVGALLLLVYRSLLVAILPFLSVGAAVGVASAVVGLLTEADLLPTSMLTNAVMLALMLGAGTDYSIFFIGRYQEGRRNGLSVDEAFRASYRGVAPVVLASGATVAGALSCMNLTQLEMLRSLGLPCAVGILFTVASAVTVTPAVLLIGARRFGLFEPKKTASSAKFWRRMGVRIARWPKPIFAGTFVLLILFMLVIPTASYNYDELQFVPKNMPSAAGLMAAEKHFPLGQMYPDMVLIQAPHDLRNSADIAVLEKSAQRLNQMPDVTSVQWLTRPLGVPLDQASLTYSVGLAGSLAAQNSVLLTERSRQLRHLTDNLASTIATIDGLREQLQAAQQGAQRLAAISVPIQNGLKQLKDGMRALGPVIEPVRTSVDSQQNCADDVLCAGARSALSNFDSISSLASNVQQLLRTSNSLSGSVVKSAQALPVMLESMTQMHEMATSTNAVLSQLASQVDTVTAVMQDIGRSSAGTGDYFYFPARLLSDPRFTPYLHLLFSKDGTTTRMIVAGKSSSYSTEGQKRARELAVQMKIALKGTPLEGSVVSVAGPGALMGDMHTILNRDEKIVLVGALTVILTVVILLLRSVVATFVVIGSVLLSFGSTMGISLVIWQHVLGVQLHWSIPVAVFAILVSVGADYNLLIASRFREEMGAGIKTGVIRSVAGTGGVVTTAGMVFAMTMFAMLGSSLINVAQVGSTIGIGLVIDTFIVRTFTVPTIAVILGRSFWWPLPFSALTRIHHSEAG
ncbi:RND family transporter [Mycobacteroides salmoniphilum]|uniref:MMPL/RND family transporter n=1 Tax=Mycobacteroides salmoniphilum TaxID=404941 RepID=UPI0009934758|nr:RND family transporter [Mycobacteroides salmoniphilum]QCH25470.1 Membrane transport protein mmpL8 [Mycobacteroides salmoniphilum]